MTVYTVQIGDTVYSIADKFNIPYMRLVQQNIIQPNYDLVVGQNLVITYPDKVHNVLNGDTLQSIADAYGISVIQLLQNNPNLSDREFLNIGEEIIISFSKDNEEEIEVNGYAFSYINVDTLRKTLPYLTYLTIANYRVNPTGDIYIPNDENIINATLAYGVAPIMMLSTIVDERQGRGSYGTSHRILNDQEIQNNLIDNILVVLSEKKLFGVNFGFQHILKDDLQNYIDLISKTKLRLQDKGYLTFVTCIPSVFGFIPDANNDLTYFNQIGQLADRVILISYQWSYAYIPVVEQTTVSFINKFVNFIVTQIPPEKILVGITRVGYDWELPYVENESLVNSIAPNSAIVLANDIDANILFDEETQTPYFYYTIYGIEHLVWLKDAKTVNSILDIVNIYHLGGVSVWNIMIFEPQTWIVIVSRYPIAKVTNISF